MEILNESAAQSGSTVDMIDIWSVLTNIIAQSQTAKTLGK